MNLALAHPPAERADACRLLFGASPAGTALVHASAGAPWRVVRVRTAPICEAIVVQTRGGLIDGDRWRFTAGADAGAHARLRSSGATVAYSGTCFLRSVLSSASGASLMQRSAGLIVRPGVTLRVTTALRARAAATVIASEVVALADGSDVTLRTVVVRGCEPLFEERVRLDDHRTRSWRLGGFTHLGSLLAVGPARQIRTLERRLLRHRLPLSAGVSVPRPGCLLMRILGSSIDELDTFFDTVFTEAGW